MKTATNQEIHGLATCPEETKSILVDELKSLGVQRINPGYMAVEFYCDLATFYRLHLELRTASRILRILKECAAPNPQILFSQASRIHWHKLIRPNQTFMIEGVTGDRGEDFMSANDISKKIREGLQECFKNTVGLIPKVDLVEPEVVIVGFVRKGRATISIDTSGKALHKRGYRSTGGHKAPLKETLAAAVLKFAGYDGSIPLLDPMAGSGTIPIEAAYIALGKAPLIHRKRGEFGFEHLMDFDRDLWRKVQDECRGEKRDFLPQPIYASDLEEHYVDLAQSNALRARVEKHITFSCKDIRDWEAPEPTGLLIANLPYGERLSFETGSAMEQLYSDIGHVLKHKFQGWRVVLITSESSPIKAIGLRTSKRMSVLNGSLRVQVLLYEMFAGKRKSATEAKADAGVALQKASEHQLPIS